MIPEVELAVARHDGSPRDIDRTYGELAAHVTKHEIGVAGPLREHYLRGIARHRRLGRMADRGRLADLSHPRLTVPADRAALLLP